MLRVSRSLFVSVISASLICSPLFALNAGASNDRLSQQTRKSPPLNS